MFLATFSPLCHFCTHVIYFTVQSGSILFYDCKTFGAFEISLAKMSREISHFTLKSRFHMEYFHMDFDKLLALFHTCINISTSEIYISFYITYVIVFSEEPDHEITLNLLLHMRITHFHRTF